MGPHSQQLLSPPSSQGAATWPPGSTPAPSKHAPAEPCPDHPGPQWLPAARPHRDLHVCSTAAPSLQPADPQVESAGQSVGTQPVTPGRVDAGDSLTLKRSLSRYLSIDQAQTQIWEPAWSLPPEALAPALALITLLIKYAHPVASDRNTLLPLKDKAPDRQPLSLGPLAQPRPAASSSPHSHCAPVPPPSPGAPSLS